MAQTHEDHHDFSSELEELRKRREEVKSVIEQAKGRAVELEHRAEEQKKILENLGVTPETALHVLEALKHEIIYTKDLAERLIEEVENGIEEYKQARQTDNV